jgi:hypothetical protein
MDEHFNSDNESNEQDVRRFEESCAETASNMLDEAVPSSNDS